MEHKIEEAIIDLAKTNLIDAKKDEENAQALIDDKIADELAESRNELAEIANKPTDAEIAIAKQNFDEAVTEFNNKTWELGTAEEAPKLATFLLKFISEDLVWIKNGFLGIVKLDEELRNTIKHRKEDEAISLGYHALVFLAYSINNFSGVGLKQAKKLAKFEKEYNMVFTTILEKQQESQDMIKEVQFKQDVWAAALQGFKLEREPAPTDEFESPVPE
jgi:hypothetical protein